MAHKLVFIETVDVVETTLALDNFRRACDCGRGAVFFSVARGKARALPMAVTGPVSPGSANILTMTTLREMATPHNGTSSVPSALCASMASTVHAVHLHARSD